MYKILLTAFLTLTMLKMNAQTLKAYNLFSKDGKETDYQKMIEKLSEADVVLFGELHNNPIAHWLQYEVTKSLHKAKDGKLMLGAEMFEADVQFTLNEYLAGLIKESHLTREGKVWDNYSTDYAPLVDFAKKNKLQFIATNIPRRYANLVSRKGIDALEQLDKQAKKMYLPKLPIEVDTTLSGYQGILAMFGGHGGQSMGHGKGHGGPDPMNFVYAQASKDATMAYFTAKYLKKAEKGTAFIHFNGAYHSNDFQGIYWYLKKENKKLKIVTITSVEQTEVNELSKENTGRADFTICIPESMTKTYTSRMR